MVVGSLLLPVMATLVVEVVPAVAFSLHKFCQFLPSYRLFDRIDQSYRSFDPFD